MPIAERESALVSQKAVRHDIWERITAISSLVLAVVGLAALGMTEKQILEMQHEARIQLAEAHAENQVQHLMSLIDKFDGAERVAIRKSLATQRVDRGLGRLHELNVDNPPVELEDELDFCDDIGLLTGRGYLDRHDVWNAFGVWLFYLYADARPYLDNLQSPADYRECRNLVESIRPIEIKEGASTYDHPSESEIYSSYLDDIQRQPGQPPVRSRTQKKGASK